MAQALARDTWEKGSGEQPGAWSIESAGLAPGLGEGASPKARLVLEEEGIRLGRHRARPLTREMVREEGLVLTMTMAHKTNILALVPEAEKKVFTLKEFLGKPGEGGSLDIPDPFGSPEEVYREVLQELKVLIPLLFKKIKQ